MAPIVEVCDLTVAYGDKTVVSELNFAVTGPTSVGVIGPNGAGKSTLLKAMLGLVRPVSGTVRLLGQPLASARKRVAYVPQRSEIDWTFPITVIETALLGTFPSLGLFRRPGRLEREWAYHCLELVGMHDAASRQIGELSGGQQQRVFIARALAQRAELFLLDEPFAGIDVTSEDRIVEVLQNLIAAGNSVLAVHHDLTKVRDYFSDIVLLNRELVGCGPVSDVLRPDLIGQAYKADLRMFQELGAVVG